MLGLELIKQAIENNATKPAISPTITKKLVMSKLNTDIKFGNDWVVKEIIDRIAHADISDETKGELLENLKSECNKAAEDAKKFLDELFGSSTEEKQASVEADKDSGKSGEKEEIGKAGEGEESEAAQDDPKDEHKTPAEYVVERKPGQSVFNY